MKNAVRFLITVLVSLFALNAYSNPKGITRIIESTRKPADHSVMFVRLSDNKILYEYSADKLISPASVTKLLTAAAVLDKLTPSMIFKTNFYYTGTINDGVISGDLIVVGDGDPFLISEKLWPLASELRQLGIKEIAGNIVIDNSLFDDESLDAMRKYSKNYSEHSYDAPVSALGVNFNTVTVAIAPGAKVGDKATADIDPYSMESVIVRNNAATSRAGAKNALKVSRRSDRSGVTFIDITGTIALDSGLKRFYRSINNHARVSGDTIKSFLTNENIIVKGTIRDGKLQIASAKLLTTLNSYDMAHIIKGLNKYSNNFIADMLVKKLSTQAYPDAPGSLNRGLSIVNDFLKNEVKLTGDFVLRNGSGLNKDNRLSARQVSRLLEYMYKRMDLFPEFLASLPASGWDGSLKDRFKQETFSGLGGKVRAKTGTLTQPISVSTLAGYFYHKNHGLTAFAILENGILGKEQPSILDLRRNQEKILQIFSDSF